MEQGPRWQPTMRQKLVGLAVLVVFLFITYAYSAEWTGFLGKTLWDWLQLLVVPAVIAAGGLWFNRRQQEREREAQDRRERERGAQEAAQRERELEVENQRAQDEALQAYIEGMERLLIDKNLRASPEGSAARAVERARTRTVLSRLDSSRKASVLRFLYEAGLSSDETQEPTVVKLDNADLSGADLIEASLSRANLMRANLMRANLRGADLMGADLRNANLEGAYLSRADLRGADLREAHLREAHLEEAKLARANLEGAILSEAHLEGVDLMGADLSGAVLYGANLSGATGITNEELERKARSLKGTTMPNGQKYEEWLEEREGRGEDGG